VASATLDVQGHLGYFECRDDGGGDRALLAERLSRFRALYAAVAPIWKASSSAA